MDIPVERSDNYIELLKKGLNDFLYLYPDLDLILVVHGVDVWEHDILPSAKGIQLSTQQVLERDDLVYSLLKAKQLPQAWCLGGGYGPGISALYLQFLEKAL
jgi:acetoin utilization deacetylase AcuC-like enzyme